MTVDEAKKILETTARTEYKPGDGSTSMTWWKNAKVVDQMSGPPGSRNVNVIASGNINSAYDKVYMFGDVKVIDETFTKREDIEELAKCGTLVEDKG